MSAILGLEGVRVCGGMRRGIVVGRDRTVGKRLVVKKGRRSRGAVSVEKLDEWTRESVSEIVRNIGEAPFLVHVFSDEASSISTSTSTLRLQTQPAISTNWPLLRQKWEEESHSIPDGIILVEELKNEEEKPSTRKWGLLVQGRGVDCTACYILNTSRVSSCGWATTHFCLVRAQCFGDSAEEQFKKAWLQR